MSHNAESELHQKILLLEKLPGRTLIGNISIITSATTVKKYFFGSPFDDEAIHISY